MLNQEYEEQNQPSDNEEAPHETDKPVEEEKQEHEEPEEEPQPAAEPAEQVVEPQAPMTTGDLLVRSLCFLTNLLSISALVSLNPHVQAFYLQNLDEEVNPMIADLEESNALALAIVAPGTLLQMCTHCSLAIRSQLSRNARGVWVILFRECF